MAHTHSVGDLDTSNCVSLDIIVMSCTYTFAQWERLFYVLDGVIDLSYMSKFVSFEKCISNSKAVIIEPLGGVYPSRYLTGPHAGAS